MTTQESEYRKIWTHNFGPDATNIVRKFLSDYGDYLDIEIEPYDHPRCKEGLRWVNSQHRVDFPLAIFVHEKFPESCWQQIIELFPQALIFILYSRGDTNFDQESDTGPHYIYDRDFEERPDLLMNDINEAINNYMFDRGYPWELMT